MDIHYESDIIAGGLPATRWLKYNLRKIIDTICGIHFILPAKQAEYIKLFYKMHTFIFCKI